MFITLLPILDCYSQLPFRKNFVADLDVTPTVVREAPDGGFVILGTTNGCGAGLRDILLVRTDPNGDTIWVKTYGSASDEFACGMVLTGDSGFVVVGIVDVLLQSSTTAFVIRLNADGEVIWARSYESIAQVGGIVQSPDGGFVLTGMTPNQPPIFNVGVLLLKIDPLGSIVWSRSFAVFENELSPTDLSAMNDGGYLLSATIWNSVDQEQRAVVIRTDQDGNISWSRCYQSTNDAQYNKLTSGSAIESMGGDCLICGAYYLQWAYYRCLFVMKLDPNGDHIWTKSYPAPALGGNVHSCSALLEMINGDILACGYRGLIIRTDSVGNVVYSNMYDNLYGLSVGHAQDDEILLSGASGGWHGQIGFARADASGSIDCEQWDYPVLVTDSVVELVNEVITPQIPPIIANGYSITQGWCSGYMVECGLVGVPNRHSNVSGPWVNNPVYDWLTINGTTDGGQVGIFDLSGSELMAVTSTNSITTVDSGELSDGVYIVRYRNGDQNKSFRVVKIQ